MPHRRDDRSGPDDKKETEQMLFTCEITHGVAKLEMKLELDETRLNEKPILDLLRGGVFYEPHIANVLTRVLREGDVVVDVGANIGFFTLLASLLVGSTGHVVAFEPGAENIERLRANLALNDCKNVTIIEKAVIDRVGEVEFFINSGNAGGNALWDIAQWPGYVEANGIPARVAVPATTLDAEWERLLLPTPKVIKIDAEGADQRVLEGARDLLTRLKPRFVIAEVHPFGLAKMGCSQETLRGFIESLGYSTFGLTYAGALPRFIPAPTLIEHEIIIDLLFSKPEWVGEYWPSVLVDQR
jgi:FkbM family methyltransferase